MKRGIFWVVKIFINKNLLTGVGVKKMSDIFEQISALSAQDARVCRVAYTLNNEQPVVCTYVGEQPLFYMDYEDDLYEDEMLDDVEYTILEREIRNLKNTIDQCESHASEFHHDDTVFMESFFENADHISDTSRDAESQSMNALREILEKSRLAAAYLECAERHDVEIVFSQSVLSSHYNRRDGVIALNPDLNEADLVLATIQELRRHWQHRKGALIHPLNFQPDNAVLVNRAQQADLLTSMVRVAWEMQLAGYKAVWERIENSPMADLGRAFAREAFLDFRTINNGTAAAAVFEAWFLSERCRKQDRILIQQMLADQEGYVSDTEKVAQNVTLDLIGALGEMPFGKNYLARYANLIISDPIFTDVRDRSNANFLWFIKFERSFRETEQALQDDGSNLDQQFSSGQSHDKGKSHEKESNGTVIAIYADNANEQEDGASSQKPLSSAAKSENADDKGSKSADIVYLRAWSGE